MNMKKMIRKVAAVGAGLTMVGATLMGAMAANLNEYPAPFVSDGVFDAVLVVGDTAAPADIIGVTDIAMALQSEMIVEEVVETSEGTTVVEDGVVEDELVLGDAFTGDTYDDGDINVLADDQIRYNGEDYDYSEQIIIADNTLEPESAEDNEDYEGVPALQVTAANTEDLCYRYVFDSAVPFVSTDDIEIEFLGLDLTISGTDTNSVTLSTASEYWMDYGESMDVTLDGVDYTIEVGSIYDTEAIFTVNGVTENVAETETEDFDFEDFELEVLDVLNDDGTDNDAVKIKVGTTTSETAEDGSAAEMLGYGDDDDEAEWVWDVSSDGENITHLGVCYNQDRTEIESELDEDWELPVLFEGDELVFPNEFASVQYAATHYDNTYNTISIEYDNSLTFTDDDSGDPGLSNDDVFVFDSDMEAFYYASNAYEKFIVSFNTSGECNITVCMEDSNGNKDCLIEHGENSTVCYWDELDLKTDDEALDINITWDEAGTDGEIDWISIQNVGGYASSAYAQDIRYAPTLDGEADDAGELNVTATKALYNVEENFMTDYGIIVNTPESNLESGDYGKVVLQVPDQAVTIDIAIAASAASASSSSTTTQSVVAIEVGAAKLASEVADITAQNAIVVGGPAVNMAAAELLGNPTQEEILEMFTPGQAMIKLFENGDNVAMLVAGYDGEDTRTACKIVANGGLAEIDAAEAYVVTVSEEISAAMPVEEVEEETTEE